MGPSYSEQRRFKRNQTSRSVQKREQRVDFMRNSPGELMETSPKIEKIAFVQLLAAQVRHRYLHVDLLTRCDAYTS